MDEQSDRDYADDLLDPLAQAVGALEEEDSLRLVSEALAAGHSSVAVLRAVNEGMRIVGERYEREDIFLAGLIMAGEIFRGAIALARPGLEEESNGHGNEDTQGRVLVGTVAGDIHDIGKNVAVLALRSFGFTVKDLGVNVTPERFVEETVAFAPDVVGLSGLLTMAFSSMRDTVELLKSNRDRFAVMPVTIIGGGTIDEQVARTVGADLWTNDAMQGVRLCQELLERRSRA